SGPVTATVAKTGIEREFEAANFGGQPSAPLPSIEERVSAPMAANSATGIEVAARADENRKAKTVMPKASGDYKLPSSALLHRPDAHERIDEEELKQQAIVLTEKCAEFDVHGQITHINPGPVVTTYELKPEAGVKYNRITALSED